MCGGGGAVVGGGGVLCAAGWWCGGGGGVWGGSGGCGVAFIIKGGEGGPYLEIGCGRPKAQLSAFGEDLASLASCISWACSQARYGDRSGWGAQVKRGGKPAPRQYREHGAEVHLLSFPTERNRGSATLLVSCR